MDEAEQQLDLTVLFDISPDTFPWRVPIPKQIEDRRARMSDVLIFDILLSAGGVKHPDALYPPRDVDSLTRLLQAIEDTTYDGLKKDCLIYFLLKWHQDGREERFQEDRCIPPQFVALADAYWHLDSGIDVARGVALLSDARLNRDYPSKILQALSLEPNANELILNYVRTAKPLLTEPDDIDAYSIALAESSLMEAWQYQRSFPEDSPTRSRIIKNVLKWYLAPKPRAKPLAQLLAFPFSPYEQRLLHDYALNPPTDLPVASIPVIQDLACVRLVQSGHFTAAVKLDRQISITPVKGTFTSKLSENARKVAADRKQLMEEIMAVMPPAERLLLEAELDQIGQDNDTSALLGSRTPDTRAAKTNGVESQKAKRNGRKSLATELPVLPIPQRSGAPRFGGPISTNASTSFAAVRSMFDSISAGKPTPESPQTKKLTPEDTDPIISSRDAPSTGIVPGPSASFGESISAGLGPSRSAKSPKPAFVSAPPRSNHTSLFETRGSANRSANAFFRPPPSQGPSVGSKRPRPEEPSPKRPPLRHADTSNGSAMDVADMLQEAVDEEDEEVVQMEEEVTGPPRKSPRLEQPSASPPRSRANDSYRASVFSNEGDAEPLSSASRKAPSATPAPPGAFADTDDADEPSEREQPPSAKTQPDDHVRTTSASRIPVRKQPARLSRAQSSQADLAHSVPGAFVDEEEDLLAPLPPSGTSTRLARKGRAKSAAPDEPKATPRATRRSTRLSVRSASERGSSSPEPVSPEAPKTRRAAARTPAAKRTRKQR